MGWRICGSLTAFHSSGYPLQITEAYAALRNLVERGRGIKEKDKSGTADVNTSVTKATTIGKNSMAYVNEAGQATMNAVEFGNGNERVNVDATCTPNIEQSAPVVGDEGIKGPVLTDNNKGPVSFAKIVTSELSRKIANTLLTPAGNGADVVVSKESVLAISECFANAVYGFVSANITIKYLKITLDFIRIFIPKSGFGYCRPVPLLLAADALLQ
ncbi:hypothetical protein Tco_0680329 [Tanacetum coccineum]|uniref:Uncharacterized protein n=1 Tax=Tanacetum coccineum TaxID=301880 RepID=A0ABQ4XL41_9ASTR